MDEPEEKTWIDGAGQFFAMIVVIFLMAIMVLVLIGALWRVADWTFG